jgi:prepilin-type processing-associated H-X9-DG protein
MVRSLARWGVTLLELLVIVGIISVLFAILLPAVQKVRGAADRLACSSNLRQIGIALHSYHDSYGHFPPGCNDWRKETFHDYKYHWLSWHALVLPFIEQDQLWQQTDTMERVGSSPGPFYQADFPYNWSNPWDVYPDGTQRYQGLAAVIRLYGCPADVRTREPHHAEAYVVGLTSYLGVSGPGIYAWSVNTPPVYGSWSGKAGIMVGTNKYDFYAGGQAVPLSSVGTRLAEITDGTSSTIMVGERPAPAAADLGWWFAGAGQSGSCSCDVILGTREINLKSNGLAQYDACPAGPYLFGLGKVGNPCDVFHYWSFHSGGGNFLLADCSVRFVNYGVAPELLPQLSTKAGGEVADLP